MQSIPSAELLRALRKRREELELHLNRCLAAVGERGAPDPSLGRELDDTRAALAKVRSATARLDRH